MHAYSFAGDRVKALGVLAFLSVIVAIIANGLFERFEIGPPWLLSAPTVAAAYGLLYTVLDQLVWRWKVLRFLRIVDTLPVAGNYDGSLVSSYNQTQLPVRIQIEQTWTRIVVRFTVVSPNSSDSISLAASLVQVGRHEARLTYMYRNTVRPGVAAPDMTDHDGTAEVSINIGTGMMAGRYYNHRGRQGTLQLHRV